MANKRLDHSYWCDPGAVVVDLDGVVFSVTVEGRRDGFVFVEG
jgi:hypothetical protein